MKASTRIGTVLIASLVTLGSAAAGIGTTAASASGPTTVVTPSAGGLAATVGTAFACGVGGFRPSMRSQQIYSGSELGSGNITQFAFKTFSAFGPTVIPNITIAMSTTSKALDGLSNTFADNIGSDVTTVYSGSLTLSSAGSHAFDIIVPLQHAFSFAPATGQNLLVDVTVPVCPSTAYLDGFSPPTNGSTSIFSSTSSAAVADGSGSPLATQFTIVPPGVAQTVTETVNPGTLGFVAAPGAVTPPATTLSGVNQVTPGFTLPLDIGDATGSGSGWNVSLSASAFTDTHSHTLGGLYEDSEGSPSCDASATCTAATDSTNLVDTSDPLHYGTATIVRAADANTGMGNQSDAPTFHLAIPANSYAGTYTSTWTVSLNSGPGIH